MRLNVIQKIRAACSAVKHRDELKQVLIRRYWQNHRTLKIEVHGVTAVFDTSDFLSNFIVWHGEYPAAAEPSVCEILARLIENSKVYADVGGNIGVFSVLPALINPRCRIFYFEIDSTIRPLFIKNIKLNKILESRINIVNAAVGDRDGQLEYVPHPYFFLAKVANENIDLYDLKYHAPIITLDEYFRHEGADPDLLKIDVDGAEMSVLRGMSRILKEGKPDLLLEVHPTILPLFGSSASEVSSFLKGLDYRFFLIQDFRTRKSPRLVHISEFGGLTSSTGDMVFATTRSAGQLAEFIENGG